MNPRMTTVATITLLIGLAGGALATRWWLTPNHRSDGPSHPDTREHDEHDHDEHDENGQEHEESLVRLSPETIEQFGIEVRQAGGGQIVRVLTLPGEIALNADRVAHIVPRVSGRVREVLVKQGDVVRAGQVLAVVDSRELAEAKAADLAAEAKRALMQGNLQRVEKLAEKKIAPEQELLKAKQEFAEAEIEHRTAEAKLHALGLSEEQIHHLHEEQDVDYSRYEITAPFDGTVIEKHITLGEVVNSSSNVLVIADMSAVWANLTVYQKDLALVRLGQTVTIDHGDLRASGTVEFISPTVEEATRTATARTALLNPDRQWRPGIFITGRLQAESVDVEVLVPRTALQTVNDRLTVFVATEEGFKLQDVRTGRSDEDHVEVTEGLVAGQRYVALGGFSLKAELGKEAFAGEGHNH